MNNPENAPIAVAEQREWLLEHKKVTGSSWTQLGAQTGIQERYRSSPPANIRVTTSGSRAMSSAFGSTSMSSASWQWRPRKSPNISRP